jgi:hypothetical protein
MNAKRDLPPKPSRRADMLTEEEQRQLRQGRNKEGQEGQAAGQAEGEEGGASAKKMKRTPGQSEGDRETVEKELQRREEGE